MFFQLSQKLKVESECHQLQIADDIAVKTDKSDIAAKHRYAHRQTKAVKVFIHSSESFTHSSESSIAHVRPHIRHCIVVLTIRPVV